MTLLHVAAMPFPSPQGTQGLISSFLAAESKAGLAPHLLTYGTGDERLAPPSATWHRVGRWPRASLRSGPSLAKLLLDLRLTGAVRTLVRKLQPKAIVAHHIEALACAIAARTGTPIIYVAHTQLETELESYAPKFVAPLLRNVGGFIEQRLATRALHVAAVSSSLATRLGEQLNRRVSTLSLPWPLATEVTEASRRTARAKLVVPPNTPLLVYAGNLDRYQGTDALLPMLDALRQRRVRATLLVATECDTAALRRDADRLGLTAQLRVHPLYRESDRALVHAAADLALIPRAIPGGLPIKLLDALARGTPVLACDAALSNLFAGTGHSAERYVWRAKHCDASALADAAIAALNAPRERERRARSGHLYVSERHTAHAYLRDMHHLAGIVAKREPQSTTEIADATPATAPTSSLNGAIKPLKIRPSA